MLDNGKERCIDTELVRRIVVYSGVSAVAKPRYASSYPFVPSVDCRLFCEFMFDRCRLGLELHPLPPLAVVAS